VQGVVLLGIGDPKANANAELEDKCDDGAVKVNPSLALGPFAIAVCWCTSAR
jgi:hypothetical protein